MAEKGQSEPASPEARSEETSSQVKAEESGSGDAVVIASGEVTYNGKSHQLLLSRKGLKLMPLQASTKDGAETSNTPVVDVPWREVVCACEPPVKKSKSIAKEGMRGGGGGDGGASSRVFVVHYMVRNLKTYKVQCRSITLESTQESAEGWIMQIEEKRKEGKPQKLLVIVNPIGGKGNAQQVLKTQVQPLFALAGVELVVRVSERVKHAIEIAKTFDVSSVDGVIVMGGDGLYMEVLHALTLRKQEEEGVDFNNPDTTLIPPTVRVGIIPTGTGNAVSKWFHGVNDIDSATLNIIRGETNRANVFALHEGPKLIQYAGLLIANGFYSSLIKRFVALKRMKAIRLPFMMLSYILSKGKVVEFDTEVLKNKQEQDNKTEDADAKAEHTAAAEVSGWIKLGSKQLTASMAFPARVEKGRGGSMVINPFSPNFDVMLLDSTASALQSLQLMICFIGGNISSLQQMNIQWVHNVQAIRFHVVQPTAEGATSSTELMELCKILDVDGELVSLSEPKFEVRLHSQFLQVFSYSDYLSKDKESPSSDKC